MLKTRRDCILQNDSANLVFWRLFSVFEGQNWKVYEILPMWLGFRVLRGHLRWERNKIAFCRTILQILCFSGYFRFYRVKNENFMKFDAYGACLGFVELIYTENETLMCFCRIILQKLRFGGRIHFFWGYKWIHHEKIPPGYLRPCPFWCSWWNIVRYP